MLNQQLLTCAGRCKFARACRPTRSVTHNNKKPPTVNEYVHINSDRWTKNVCDFLFTFFREKECPKGTKFLGLSMNFFASQDMTKFVVFLALHYSNVKKKVAWISLNEFIFLCIRKAFKSTYWVNPLSQKTLDFAQFHLEIYVPNMKIS